MPSDFIHSLIEQYGLLAIFVGCLLEGESAAILGGFFAHQDVLVPWKIFVTVYAGAFCGDAVFFFAGKYSAAGPLVRRFERKPAFSYAQRMVRAHPTLYVLLNRYVYGLRMIGGVAAGLAGIRTPKFLALNALSSLAWSGIFMGIGYVFGTAAEQIIGSELARHERLLVAVGIGVFVVMAGFYLMHRLRRHQRPRSP
ncbi:DedA family protein [Devosia nitrariae]|uniref:DedA family protein n=1 Tax=Devosia nitrariae TaxID=2071872 RepID=A0ABQ5W5V9_9HYPH|nr:DedA family protein [Devosia nitrariae]GLQ55460.1 DedA family protein [Devosia nitrariae]